MPEAFSFPAKAEIWAASREIPENRNRTAFNYEAVARLKAGLTPAGATSRLETLGAQLAKAYPAENKAKVFAAIPVRDNVVRKVRSTVVLLMAAVLLVLLISCANVAHLLLARAATRTREFAVRAALGAGAARIVAQMLTESLALGLAGGIAGIATAYAGVRAVQRLAPENLPRMADVRVDWTVLAFAIAVSVLSSVLFGLAPAWQALRNDVQDGLRASSGRGVVGARSVRLRNTLVTCEIALSFALAVGAGLLVRSFVELNSVPLGFRTENISGRLRAFAGEHHAEDAGQHSILRRSTRRHRPSSRSEVRRRCHGPPGRPVRFEREIRNRRRGRAARRPSMLFRTPGSG